jgi:hypothetical protein
MNGYKVVITDPNGHTEEVNLKSYVATVQAGSNTSQKWPVIPVPVLLRRRILPSRILH